MKKIISLILALVLVCGLVPAALAASGPAVSSNEDDHFYINAGRFYHPIYSNLAWENDCFVRAEAIGSELGGETYDQDFRFLSGKSIPLELPIFGGVRMDSDYNFVVVGQDTLNEDGCEDYSFYAAYDKDKILLVEKWLNEESLEKHKTQEHFKKLLAIKEDYVIETAGERY